MLRGKSVSSSDVVTQLNQLYDDYWEFILKEYPLSATYLGDHRYDGSLEDASEDAFHRRVGQSHPRNQNYSTTNSSNVN